MSQKIINFFCFIAMMVGVLGYSMHEDKVNAKTRVLTEKQAEVMTQEIINTYAPLILKDLGVPDDGVLSKITVRKGVPVDDDFTGICYTEYETVGNETKYTQGSAYIELFPLGYLTVRQDGESVWLEEGDRPTKDQFREDMIETLAHELRHYWQYQTGVIFQHPDDTDLPHDDRWREKDADQYMEKYYKTLKNKKS